MKDLEKLQVADKSYYITANTILSLAAKASKLFKVSKPEQKREILNLVLLNCTLDEENVVYDLKKPFDTVLEYASRSEWLPLVNAFKNREIEFGFSLQNIQTVFDTFKILPQLAMG